RARPEVDPHQVAEREMAELALTTTARALFRTGLGQAAVAEVHRSLTPVLNGVTGRALLPDPLGALPTPGNRRFRDSLHRLVSIVDDMVARYRASGTDHGDLLSTLVATHHSDAEVRAQVLNLLMAGTETTATTLTWALYQLAASPEATARLSAELAAELGERPVTAADLPRLGYLDRVLTEVLRLRTPVWLLMRTTVAPVRLAGAELPPGTEVLVVPPVLHRDPALYPAPLAFHPDRWLAPEADTWRRTRLFAFGAGAHHCVGDGFARTEMAIALATIHRRWHVRLAPGARVRERTRAFLKPTGVSLLVDPR
ncbi:cytochrome P450, partial [Crossiella equi]|uniref:cytochrome P450 n=1 Tax=Crossiella equi TaxID=130796 RepID=UPI001178466C